MNYETHFDLATMPFEYGRPLGAIALAVLVIGYGGYRVFRMDFSLMGFFRNYKAMALVAVGTFIIGYTVRNSWDFFWMQSSAASGQVEHAEGVIEDYWIKKPVPARPMSIFALAMSNSSSCTGAAMKPSSQTPGGRRPS